MRLRGILAAAAAAAAALTALAAPPAAASGPPTCTWWCPLNNTGPNNGPEWQWELDHPLDTSNSTDMGLNRTDYGGGTASNPTVYDIDGIENPASTVTTLHNDGDKVICYIEIGAANSSYTAAQEGISTTYYAQLQADGDLGNTVPGYSTEKFVNINNPSVIAIEEAQISQQCAAKGFDAVEPDLDDTYSPNWTTSQLGFTLTESTNITYDQTIADYAHSLGLAWAQKNGDNDATFSTDMEPYADFLLTEECNKYNTCGINTPPYLNAYDNGVGKLVLDAEYFHDWPSTNTIQQDLGKFCPYDATHKIDGNLFLSSGTLAGQNNPCA